LHGGSAAGAQLWSKLLLLLLVLICLFESFLFQFVFIVFLFRSGFVFSFFYFYGYHNVKFKTFIKPKVKRLKPRQHINSLISVCINGLKHINSLFCGFNLIKSSAHFQWSIRMLAVLILFCVL
jgi:hypothetical protein